MKKYFFYFMLCMYFPFFMSCSDDTQEIISESSENSNTNTSRVDEMLLSGIQRDSMALVTLYKSTDGLRWHRRRNWLKTNICFWQGVKVADINGEPRVIWLDLACAGLSGTLPKEIGQLSELRRLVLSYNEDLKGNLIDEVYQLKNLVTLNTNFSSLTGSLSPLIGNLTQLDTLTMWTYLPDEEGIPYAYRMSGQIPTEIGKLKKLRYLRLGRNGFTGKIPNEIGNMISLRFIDLSQCDLDGEIPASLGDLPHINEIYLFDNQLSGQLPNGLMNAKTLDILSAHHNQLSGNIPVSIAGLTNISILKLSHNQLSGELPKALTQCKRLSLIELNDNQFSGDLPAWTGSGFENLTSIDLSNNQFTGNLPERKGHYLPGAGTFYASFYVSGNCLTGDVPDCFLRFIQGRDEVELRSRILPQQDGYGFSNLK